MDVARYYLAAMFDYDSHGSLSCVNYHFSEYLNPLQISATK